VAGQKLLRERQTDEINFVKSCSQTSRQAIPRSVRQNYDLAHHLIATPNE